MAQAIHKHPSIEWHQTLFGMQLFSLIMVGLAAVGVWLIGLVYPNFFVYPYMTWGGWEAVWKFWPLYAWGAGLTLLSMSDRVPIHSKHNQELYVWEVATSILAGVWEELAFRWAFICYAMISITLLNWFFSVGLGWILAIACVIGAVSLLYERQMLLAIPFLAAAVACFYIGQSVNPVYWLYQFVTWIIHYTTLFQMDSVLYGGHEKLLIFGAVLANSWFRDGHKYQGDFGIVNSWYAGMALLYATVTYGLWTAIAVHAIYDIIVGTVRYVSQKTA